MKILVRPRLISQFAEPEDASFCLVTNPELFESFEIEKEGGYAAYSMIAYSEQGQIRKLLESEIPPCAHVLVISPNVFFRSPEQEWIGPRRKIMAMACNSTPTSLEAVRHFLAIIEATNASEQEAFSDRFFERVEATPYLEIVDTRVGTKAVFEHLSREFTWNQQAGELAWGEQQIAPAGEISVLPADIWDFSERSGLALDGEVALRGYPILHSGEPSFTREDQVRIWRALSGMEHEAVIARIESGFVTHLRPAGQRAEAACRMLQTLFEVDSRYRMIEELGFAVNTSHRLMSGNLAMNEVHGGTNGVLHFGLGLTPYTQYHLDIIAPHTQIFGQNGLVHGPRELEAVA